MSDVYLPSSLDLPWILPSLTVGLVTERGFGGTRGQVRFPLEIMAATNMPLPHHLREKTVLQSTNRKLERRVKELSIQIDDERQHVNDQKDQVRITGAQATIWPVHTAFVCRPRLAPPHRSSRHRRSLCKDRDLSERIGVEES